MSGQEVTWAGVSSVTIPELVCGKATRTLLGESRGTYVSIPGRPGSWHFAEQPGRRKISLECFVEAAAGSFPAGRRDAVTAVADWLDVAGDNYLILGDEPGIFYKASLITPPEVEEWREVGQFTLEFMVDPYSYDANTTTYAWSAVDDVAISVDFGLAVFSYPVFQITPTNGTSLTGFTLRDNDRTLTYNTAVLTGNTVTINATAMAVLAGTNTDVNVTGAYDPVDLLMTGVTGSFPLLYPGINELEIITLGGDVTTYDISILYRKRYRK